MPARPARKSSPRKSTQEFSAEEKSRWLYKEFGLFDDAIGWARDVNQSRRVTVLIEADDGTELDKNDILLVITQLDRAAVAAREVH